MMEKKRKTTRKVPMQFQGDAKQKFMSISISVVNCRETKGKPNRKAAPMRMPAITQPILFSRQKRAEQNRPKPKQASIRQVENRADIPCWRGVRMESNPTKMMP